MNCGHFFGWYFRGRRAIFKTPAWRGYNYSEPTGYSAPNANSVTQESFLVLKMSWKFTIIEWWQLYLMTCVNSCLILIQLSDRWFWWIKLYYSRFITGLKEVQFWQPWVAKDFLLPGEKAFIKRNVKNLRRKCEIAWAFSCKAGY